MEEGDKVDCVHVDGYMGKSNEVEMICDGVEPQCTSLFKTCKHRRVHAPTPMCGILCHGGVVCRKATDADKVMDRLMEYQREEKKHV